MRKQLFIIRLLLSVSLPTASIFPAYSQLRADFSASPAQGCAPLVVRFKDSSAGNPTAWRWDLGNGTVSFLQNPAATYFNPGTYTIKLVIKNAAQADSITKVNYITVFASPVSNFAASDTTGCFPLKVQFTDFSSPGNGTISSWEWDFGDGASDTVKNPQHVYTALGNYNVSLRVVNSNGCVRTLTRSNYIKLTNGVKPGFNFSAPNNCKPPTPISFTNLSSGTGTLRYRWEFGDGGTSTSINPVYTYNTPGVYTVKLLIRNDFGCIDSIIKPNAITIGSVTAGFSSPNVICAGQNFTLTNTSVPSPVAALWSFGDGTASALLQPTKNYSTPGIFLIKLVSDFGACKDSITKPIQVLPKPTAAFSAINTHSCKPPLTTTFTNTAIGGASYKWFFGDGDSSTQSNPTHTYQNFGEYDVRLVVTNANGCTDVISKTKFIQIKPAQVTISNLPQEGCVPYSFRPLIAVNSPDSLTTFQWFFGDGNTSTLKNPTNIYTAPGTYSVKLVYTTSGGCTDSVLVTNAIRVGDKPVVNFSATPRIACAFQMIQFNDLSTGGAGDRWFWQFGDGGTSTEKNPGYQYQDTGYFSVTLHVWSNGCRDTLSIPQYMNIKPPVARFIDSSVCTANRTRWFLDRSIGATSWFWDFGDGNTSIVPSPSHTYTAKGVYIVTLTVKNDTCEHTTSRQIAIIAEDADFKASDSIICKGTPVQFKTHNINPVNISRYIWNFGDGISQGSNGDVMHIYRKAGKFDVQLVITDINGCSDTLVKPLYIQVDGPTANFNSSAGTVCTNSTIVFTDGSQSDGTHAIQQWIWDYGDGMMDTLTASPFQHTYNHAGNYSVKLKVTDSKSCVDSITKFSFITISKPTALFSSIDTLSCSNKSIRFLNQSYGNTLKYYWEFGDGQTETAFQPVHQYATEGSYSIKLKATDRFGCTDSILKPAYIKIKNPKAGFTVSDSVATCPPLVVNFTNQSFNFIQYAWDFGDGTKSSLLNPFHFYTYPGTYRAKLTVTSPGGCIDSFIKLIVVRGPQGDFIYDKLQGCVPTTINFTGQTKDNVSLVWDFNDGDIAITGDLAISHTYTRSGTYVPKMILKDPQGCTVPIQGPDTIYIYGIDAKFGLSQQVVCDSGSVNFIDSSVSNDLITSYQWALGDGSTSTARNPSRFYKNPGNYNISLIVATAFGCTDTAKTTAPLKVAETPIVAIKGNTGECIPANFLFEGLVIKNDSSSLNWRWDFGNGTFSNVQMPATTVYPIAGNYTVKLITTTSSGCADTATKHIQAYPLPAVDAGPAQVICRGTLADLQATGAVNYSWRSDVTLSCFNCPNPKASPAANTVYYVLGKNIYGCNATDSVLINVIQPSSIQVGPGDTLCKGESLNLWVKGAEQYLWSPSIGLNDNRVAQPRARPDTTIIYRVIGRDNQNCFQDTGYVPVVVYPYPTVNAGADITMSVGSSIELKPLYSKDITQIQWQPATGLSCSNCPSPQARPKNNIDYKVSVRNQGGCLSSDEISLFVFCDNSNLFMPNTFSPNGDGNNDVFYPRGKGLFTIKALRIFNRWGEVIFERTNFGANELSKGWDGTQHGKPVLQDVYVYTVDVICENQVVLNYKGNVALIR